MASSESGELSGPVVHEPNLSEVAPVFDVTVGLSEDEPSGVVYGYEVLVRETDGDTTPSHVIRGSSRRMCIGPLHPGHSYCLQWRYGGDASSETSHEGWSCGVVVRVCGKDHPMVDLRRMKAVDIGRVLRGIGARRTHSERWVWVRGVDMESSAGQRAQTKGYLYGGLPRPSMTVSGSFEDSSGGVGQPLCVSVLSSVKDVSEYEVGVRRVSDDGSDVGMIVLYSSRGGSGSVVLVDGLECGVRYALCCRVCGVGRRSVSLWSCREEVVVRLKCATTPSEPDSSSCGCWCGCWEPEMERTTDD